MKKILLWIRGIFRKKKQVENQLPIPVSDANLLQTTTISEYIEILKAGTDVQIINEIDDLLSSQIQGVSGGFDLALFQMEKDMLLYMCKYMLAMFNFDSAKMELYASRMDMLRATLEKKKKKGEPVDPYKSFLQWLFTLKKYYGSEVDRSNTLIELVVATEQMMKWYKSQEEQIEKQKQLNKRK